MAHLERDTDPTDMTDSTELLHPRNPPNRAFVGSLKSSVSFAKEPYKSAEEFGEIALPEFLGTNSNSRIISHVCQYTLEMANLERYVTHIRDMTDSTENATLPKPTKLRYPNSSVQTNMFVNTYSRRRIWRDTASTFEKANLERYGVATISRLLKMIGLLCRM